MQRTFADPFETLPLLEREIIRLRAYEAVLVLFYKEEIERKVLNQVDCFDRSKARRVPNYVPRAPKGAKDRLKKSLRAMVSDGAISEAEKVEIVNSINFRNDVGHRIDHLFSDLEQGRFRGKLFDPEFRKIAKIKEFDHLAVSRLQKILKLLDRTSRTHYRFGTFSVRGHLMFYSTEKALSLDIRKTSKRISKLAITRKKQVEKLNQELKLGFDFLDNLREQKFFDLRYDQGKMTPRGAEFCYLLFDKDLSDLAVAHVFEMTLRSVQVRRRKWKALGGAARPKPDWRSLPTILTPSRFDD